jgi:predicted nucleotide-binding protein
MRAEDAREASKQLRTEAAKPDVRRDGPAHSGWQAKVEAVMAKALGPDSATLDKFRNVSYSIGIWTGAPGEDARDARFFAEQTERAAAYIDAAIYELDGAATFDSRTDVKDGPIFVVHGHAEAQKYELVRLLDRTTERHAIILHEQPNVGATILEKFERHAASASFAVIVLTGDDEGRSRRPETMPLTPRGRQNVILEMGFFLGQLGRSRVAVLLEEGVEKPSDLDGLVYIPMDNRGAWKLKLLKEIEASGITVDHSRIP